MSYFADSNRCLPAALGQLGGVLGADLSDGGLHGELLRWFWGWRLSQRLSTISPAALTMRYCQVLQGGRRQAGAQVAVGRLVTPQCCGFTLDSKVGPKLIQARQSGAPDWRTEASAS